MRSIDIYDCDTLELLDLCYQYESVQVKRKFRGVGSISIVLNSLDEGNKFNIENYVGFNGETYIVENIHKYKDSRGIVKIEVFGSHLNKLLEHRVLLPNMTYSSGEIADQYTITSGSLYTTNAQRMVRLCFLSAYFVSPYNSGEWLKRDASITMHANGETLKADNSYKLKAPVKLSEALNIMLSHKKLGYCMKVDYSKKEHQFWVYEPIEKDVVFSEVFGNIDDADFYSDITDEKNVAISANETSAVYETTSSDSIGFKRKEILDDKTSSDWKSSHKSITNASFDIVDNGSFKYRTDYDLGDIVEYYNSTFGISTKQQITEITETYDKFETVSISIGDFVPTIYDKLKGVL